MTPEWKDWRELVAELLNWFLLGIVLVILLWGAR